MSHPMSEGEKEESRDGVWGRSAGPAWAVESDPDVGYRLLLQMPNETRHAVGSLRTNAPLTRAILTALNDYLIWPATESTGDSAPNE